MMVVLVPVPYRQSTAATPGEEQAIPEKAASPAKEPNLAVAQASSAVD
jgi:hypothetical protein